MEKVIKVGKQEVRLSNNMAWTMEYRDQFGKDIVPTLMPMLMTIAECFATVIANKEDNELTLLDVAKALEGRTMDVFLPLYQVEFVDVLNIAWAMAKAADEDILPPKQWVKQFDVFPADVVVPAVYDLVIKGSVSSKNLKRLKTLETSLKNLQPSRSTTSSSPDLSED